MSAQQFVFLVAHDHRLSSAAGSVDSKLIGAFETEASAQEAVRTVGSAPGFRDAIDGFLITKVPLGTINEAGFLKVVDQ